MSSDNSRFSCLKPTNNDNNTFRSNRFRKPIRENKINSRWKRSKSPEKTNRFKSRNQVKVGNYRRKNENFRNNNRNNNRNNKRFHSKKFHNVEKDEKGRPIISGATNNSFNPFDIAMKKSINKKTNKKETLKIISKKKDVLKVVPKSNFIENTVVYEKKAEEGFKKKELSEIEKQMILNMQYETDSEPSEDEEEEL